MDGLELAARFAFPPNTKHYCGKRSFQKTFAQYLSAKKPGKQKLSLELKKFVSHYAYLKLIAKHSGRKPFDYSVVEAFWIGNGLLERVPHSAIQRMFRKNFAGPGLLSPARAKALAQKLPSGVFPHHSLHALYVHSITGVVPPTIKTARSCIISFGKVLFVRRKKAFVRRYTFKTRKPSAFHSLKPKWLPISCNGVQLAYPRQGDWVALHWGVPVFCLSQRQRKNLEKYALCTLNALQ